jgi:outer membrane protein TolC
MTNSTPSHAQRPWLFGLLLAILPAVAHAAISFEAALKRALQESPMLAASAARIDAARSAAIPAGELPDPKLALGIDNLPLDGPDRFSLTRDFMTMRRIGVMQEVPNRAKRDARASAGQARTALAEAEAAIVRSTVKRETALAWIARYEIERQLVRIDALAQENRLLDAAVRARLAGGQGRASEIVAPRQEAALIEERRDALTARREQAIAALKRWVGAAADEALEGTAPDWPIEPDQLTHRLRHHPELAAFGPQGWVLDAEAAEAEAARKPDWSVALSYQLRGPQFSNMAGVEVSFDLPLFSGTRQEPRIAAKRAERTALNAEREALLREHAAQLASDLADYQRLSRALTRQREVLLPLAAEKVELTMAAWRGGKGELADLVAARRERIDAELKLIELEGERLQMAARLFFTYEADAPSGETK